jgi:hypothetical protein
MPFDAATLASDVVDHYNSHTVGGTWTIILTVIFTVFALLLLLRLVMPVKASLPTAEQELARLIEPSDKIVEV